MFDGLSALFSGSFPEGTIAIGRARRGRNVGVTRLLREIGVDAPAFAVTPSILRLAATGAIAVNGVLPVIELWKVAVVPDSASVRYAALATAVTIALHLRHVASGLRDERPPAGTWTLAALAIANAAATVLVGRMWTVPFAAVAVSVLIVVRGAAAPTLVAAIVLSPLLLARTPLPAWQLGADPMTGASERFLVWAVAWWTVTLYVPVRLVAMIQQLEVARRSLESRAVIQTRSRIEGDLLDGLELALERISARGELARGATARDPVLASAHLQALVKDSRRALTDARRLAAGYRTASLRAELDAATALLQAAGSACRVVVAQNVPIDAAGTRSSGAIRAAVVRALEGGAQPTACVIRVQLGEAGGPRVDVTP